MREEGQKGREGGVVKGWRARGLADCLPPPPLSAPLPPSHTLSSLTRRLTTIVGAARDRLDLLGGGGSGGVRGGGVGGGALGPGGVLPTDPNQQLLLRERGLFGSTHAALGEVLGTAQVRCAGVGVGASAGGAGRLRVSSRALLRLRVPTRSPPTTTPRLCPPTWAPSGRCWTGWAARWGSWARASRWSTRCSTPSGGERTGCAGGWRACAAGVAGGLGECCSNGRGAGRVGSLW